MIDLKDTVYFGTVLVGALAAVFSDRWQNRQNQKDIEELKHTVISKDDYEKDMARIKDINALQWEKIDESKKWEALHEKHEIESRSLIELKIATLHGKNEKFESMLESINKKLDEFIIEWKHDRDKNG